jgi:hypothetical protein
MATITYETPTSFASQLTTELNSLANATDSAASAAYDNSTNLDLFADVSLVLASINPTDSAGARCEIHLLPRLADGSTYADISSNTIVGVITVTDTSSAKNAMLRGVPIPPGFFKWALTNRTTVTLGASSNVVSVRTYGGTVA